MSIEVQSMEKTKTIKKKKVDKVVIRDNLGKVRVVSEEELDRLSKSIEYTVLDIIYQNEITPPKHPKDWYKLMSIKQSITSLKEKIEKKRQEVQKGRWGNQEVMKRLEEAHNSVLKAEAIILTLLEEVQGEKEDE